MKYDDRKKEIGLRINALRTAKGMKRGEFLRQLYMSETSLTSLRNWENGKILPDLDTLSRMAELFECDIGYLLCDYNEKTRDIEDGVKKIGLHGDAIESIIGMQAYGPSKSIDALNYILMNATRWKYFARKTEKLEKNDVLFAIADYLLPHGDAFVVHSNNGQGSTEFFANDTIQPSSDNSLFNAGALFDRVKLDIAEDTLKELKNKIDSIDLEESME